MVCAPKARVMVEVAEARLRELRDLTNSMCKFSRKVWIPIFML